MSSIPFSDGQRAGADDAVAELERVGRLDVFGRDVDVSATRS
jgi:hypothetical protein